MLYVLPSKQNSLDEPILPILPTTLVFYIGTNYLSGKRTLSSSCKMRVILSSKREKRRITKVKRVTKPTK